MHASSQIVNYAFHSRLSALLRKAPTLTGAYNTAYTAHFVRPNFGFAETSYMLGTLYKIPNPPL